MSKNISGYLEDIIDCIDHVQKYTKSVSQKDLETDDLLFDAVLRRFQVMGEATKRIPQQFKEQHADVQWKFITGTRDVLVHDYDDINIERLWQTIKEDLPVLKKQIKDLLKHL